VRRIGLGLLAIGLAGFLFASAQKSRYETGAEGAAAASSAAETRLRWETARWLLVGVGVIGLVFTVLPGKKA
jgi:hypothetical protein